MDSLCSVGVDLVVMVPILLIVVIESFSGDNASTILVQCQAFALVKSYWC
jgi:hypothetical protein